MTAVLTADEPAAAADTAVGHQNPWRSRAGLLVLLVGTAVFYLWGFNASGYANSFYSAAVQAGSVSWKAFFYGSSDAANSITVDKPPASLWVMALSVRIFGLSSWSILVPQVAEGVATVAVLYTIVRRRFGAAAGLLAGALLALTPVAALMFRFNNPDALLALLMLAAVWAVLRGVEDGRTRWLVLAGVFVGLGFLTKQLQVFLVLPALALTYLFAAPVGVARRLWQLVVGGAAMVASAGWWLAIVELVPAADRPFIGGSQHNSILELTLGYNGFGRLSGSETGSVGGGPAGAGGPWGATGITRLFTSEFGGQIAWLLPAALVMLLAGLVMAGRRPRTHSDRAFYLAMGLWLVVTWLTFSFMAGIFHAYYTVAMAPAIAALVGAGGVQLWRQRGNRWAGAALAGSVLMTVVWAWVLLGRTPTFVPWLRTAILLVGVLAAVGLLVRTVLPRLLLGVVALAALFAGVAGPAAYAVQTVGTAHTGALVAAGPVVPGGAGGFGPGEFGTGGQRGPGGVAPGGFGGQRPPGAAPGGFGGQQPPGGLGGAPGIGTPGSGGLLNASTPSAELTALLAKDAGNYTWVAAAVGSQSASGYQLATQHPVMPIGGFNGSDPSPTLAQFQQNVTAGKVHYFISSGREGGAAGAMGGSGSSAEIGSWVQMHFTASTVGTTTIYDLTSPTS